MVQSINHTSCSPLCFAAAPHPPPFQCYKWPLGVTACYDLTLILASYNVACVINPGTGTCNELHLVHYNDVVLSAMASQITSLTDVYSTVYSRRRSKKTPKLRVTGLCEGNSQVTSEFPAQRASNAENVSFWWRHHDFISHGVRVPWQWRLCPQADTFRTFVEYIQFR